MLSAKKLVKNIDFINLIIALFLFLLPFSWKGISLVANGESYSVMDVDVGLKNIFSTWTTFGFGNYNLYIAMLPFVAIVSAISKLFTTPVAHFCILGIMLSATYISMVLLLNSTLKKSINNTLASLIYLFSPYFLTMFTWQPIYQVLFIVAPLSIYYIILILRKKSFDSTLLLSTFITFFFSSILAVNIPLLIIYILSVAIIVIILFPFNLKKHIFNVLLISILFIAANIYWLLPFSISYKEALGGGSLYNANLSSQQLFDKPYLNGLTMTEYYWFDKYDLSGARYFSYYDNYIKPAKVGTLLLLLICSCVVFSLRKKKMIFIFLFLLMSVLLSMGSSGALGKLYTYALIHIPFFSIFRASDLKFPFINAICLSILTGCSLKQIRKYKYYRIVYLCVITIVLVLSIPFINGQALNNKFYVNIPDYWLNLKYYARNLNIDNRILLYPINNSPFDTYSWGYAGPWLTTQLFNIPSIGYMNNYGYSVQEKDFYKIEYAYSAINKSQSNYIDILKRFNIGYILVRNDFNSSINKNGIFSFNEIPAANIKVNLQAKPQIFGRLLIYDLSKQINPSILTGDIVHKFRISRTAYAVQMYGREINLLNSYSANWRLCNIDKRTYNSLYPYKASIQQNFITYYLYAKCWLMQNNHFRHTKVYGYANKWSSSKLEHSFFLILYIPQVLYFIGLTIVIITFSILCCSTIIIALLYGKNRKN